VVALSSMNVAPCVVLWGKTCAWNVSATARLAVL
jgi:hypothetical protein